MAFSLHFHPADAPIVHSLRTLSEVFLLRSSWGPFYLMATDGVVVRTQRVDLCHKAEDHKGAPTTDDTPPLVYLANDHEDPLPDLARFPQVLEVSEWSPKGTAWELRAPLGTLLGEDLHPQTWRASMLRDHLRACPVSFRSWLVLMDTAALARFVSTFPRHLQASLLWITEPVGTPPEWARYWAFHARTREPLGLVLGIRSPETVAHFQPKK